MAVIDLSRFLCIELQGVDRFKRTKAVCFTLFSFVTDGQLRVRICFLFSFFLSLSGVLLCLFVCLHCFCFVFVFVLIHTDKGSEFTNRQFQNVLKTEKIHMTSEVKASIAEKFVRSFKSRTRRYFTW